MNEQTFANELIDAMGGTSAVARLTGLTPGRISQWRQEGIPVLWKRLLRAEHPAFFARLAGSSPSKPAGAVQEVPHDRA